MTLHPDSRRFLDNAERWWKQNDFPPCRRMTPAQARSVVRQQVWWLDPPQDPTVTGVDDSVPTPAGDRPVRIFRPPAADTEPLPVVVYVHGGGYVVGSIEDSAHEAQRLATHCPAVVVSTSYRLAPEHPFPAAVDDAWSVLNWVAAQPFARGRSLGIAGCSAGGGLAAAVVRRATDTAGPRVSACYLLCPWLDLRAETPSRAAFGKGFGLDEPDMVWFADQYAAGDRAFEPEASPARHRPPVGHPPTVILVAACDPLRDEAVHYADALEATGTAVSLHEGAGMVHAFNVLTHAIPAGGPAVAGADRAFAALLAQA